MKAKVYFSKQITPEKVVELYKAELSDARILAADGRDRTRHHR